MKRAELRRLCRVNAVTGNLKSGPGHLSGYATYQDFASYDRASCPKNMRFVVLKSFCECLRREQKFAATNWRMDYPAGRMPKSISWRNYRLSFCVAVTLDVRVYSNSSAAIIRTSDRGLHF